MLITFGRDVTIPTGLRITFTGHGAQVSIGSNTSISGHFVLAEDSKIIIGSNVGTTAGVDLHADKKRKVVIGNSCIVGRLAVFTTDYHAVFDRTTKEKINPSQDVIIGNNVWIALGVFIMKGVTIEDFAVVGSRSVVTKSLPGYSLCAGIPAKVIRENIVWSPENCELFPEYLAPYC